ncbi:putative ATP-grasp-modified RiPP [Saccharothrix sp.]|uniref:putative ATP-grasp-modified RiPP n=1 Tax=Saccharothrix sp. TaxID=1873460 RepID=UPI0028124CC6|nr:putative ATP-grasp-modified RiPP [Saccharothrix sp.]
MAAEGVGVPESGPLAPAATRLALARSRVAPGPEDVPSPDGVRPWGLRRAVRARPGRALPAWRYDAGRQQAVDAAGVPLIDGPVAGDPTAHTTATVDREDPPSSEDWIND